MANVMITYKLRAGVNRADFEAWVRRIDKIDRSWRD